ncbi:GNAT family N-acetyltransferase [Blastococcus sp. TML/M2B]|uniref:lipid II:glycine glycyltransferase FemX n=1 Tax=unclassified Blastococcus TaxID=2619396 RepID=UPI00190CA2D8|nr:MULTISPECIES: GNAT family N-acetyltransferase [unclassified Blastococcus]MBN1091267.1 GNAT family N-acetyltransferase [Blastococcus sp. TML/M2B]MBN1095176.1 GNAT family N-acetyltransferase [Blastococcus sp. TML/C7B]
MTGVRQVDPRTDPLWAELARSGGSLFTSPPWIGAVSSSYGFEPTARVAVDGSGRAVGGAVWVDVQDLRGGRRLALPFSDRADPIVADAAAWAEVAADAFAGDLPFTLRCLDGSPAVTDPRFTATGEAAWHRTCLDRPLEDLRRAVRSQTRRNIATAERAGVEVVLSPEREAVAEYHRLHVGLRKRKYRLLAQPLEFFDRIWQAFAPADGIRTGLALVDGRPVAGAVYLVWQDTVYYKFGASEADSLHLRPNDALHWALLRWAHDRGLRALDWGLSELDQPGLCAYKRNWGSEERRIRTLNAGGPPVGRSAEVEHTLRLVTDLLTDPAVPDPLAARAGASLYRFFC